ncbi:MAG: hypothetical protein QOE36_1775 [Gaiellaceae bacterium]|nr:hypothetical protein [Gaiellaceae bacterium]
MGRKRVLALVGVLAAVGIGVRFANHSPAPQQQQGEVAIAWVDTPATASQETSEKTEPGDDASATETYWNDRLTYPTGNFDGTWLRRATHQDTRVSHRVPAGEKRPSTAAGSSSFRGSGRSSSGKAAFSTPTGLITNSFVALGPKPERMTGCSGCFDYSTTSGRINAVVVDPTTTTNGSIVAYSASDGGGVWKTTNCCSSATTWSAVTDDPQLATIAIDTLTIDPSNHNTIYAGTGDLNYGSFSMGSQGILKSTNAGATWTTLGETVFGPVYSQPVGKFPQYDSVGKVRVDPNNSNKVVAGTKKGLFFSYNGGTSWTGPCLTNSFTTQRQDITGLELTNAGGSTRILAAVGARGYATPVQFDLDQNGANGIYSATMASGGCPSFTSIASNANGFVFGSAVSGSAYTAGASLNAGSGAPYVSSTSGDQLGRIDLGVAPSNPNVIYAQVQSITASTSSGCGSAKGCQLGAWATTNGGTSWSFMGGSAGASLRQCATSGVGSGTAGTGDYPQNWYDQAVAVDPNNPDRVYFDTFDIWLATRSGTTWYDVSCGYSGVSPKPVHTDQHALAFVAGSSSLLLAGNDGGANGTTNANAAADGSARPSWFNMDGGYNTIEYYDGDLGPSFATAANPTAAGGAQDNMDSFVTFAGAPTGPTQWQGNIGGDGFYAAIDGKGGYVYASNNSGALHRCTANCSNSGGVFGGELRATTMRGDRQSFAEPFDLFRGTPGGSGNAECAGTRCNHLMVGTYRVWETLTSDGGTITWTARTPDLTKNTLVLGTDNRSYINQLHYAPRDQTLGIVATNDGNVELLRGLGGAAGAGATTMDVTGGNAILPNRPILDAAIDPTSTNTAANPLIGYAAVGGFDANTPSRPGHVFRVVCNVDCASSAWTNKTGNLPDIPVDSVIANPNVPQQVFAGTDFGLFFTNDITAASPTWYRFANGLSNAMIWSLTIDRGNTTLGVWTRSRGAYAWPLPTAAIKQNQTITFAAVGAKTFGDPDFDVIATASSGLPVNFAASGDCTVAGTTVHITGAGNCTVTASQGGNIDYNAAPDVPRAFAIAKASQTVTFAAISPKTYGDADFDPGATATSGLDVSYAAAGSCTIVGAAVHITGAGSCTVTASQSGNGNFDPAPNAEQTFAIAKADQTINFGTASDIKTFGDADFDVTATASSGLAVALEVVSGPCTLSASTSPAAVHIGGAGTCVVRASQGGNDDYNAAPEESRSFAIDKANQTIDFGALGGKTYGDADFTVSATATSGLSVTFAAAGNCTVAGSTVHITGAGECTVTASQAGDGDHNPAPDLGRTFTIEKAAQTIALAPIPDKTYGDDDFAVSATATSGNDVTFAATGDCTSTGSTIHIVAAGSCTVTASQGGDENYNAAPDVSQAFAIGKATQTIAFAPLDDKTYGDDDFPVVAHASSGLDVAFSASGDCAFVYDKVSITGAGSCTITASQDGDGNFNPASAVSRTFTIGRSGQSINFSAIDDATFGTAAFEVDATASSGLTVALGVDSGPCTLSGPIAPATVHITGAGTCVLRASQSGNANYKPAPDETRSFTIGKAHQAITFGVLSNRTWGDPDFSVGASASSALAVTFAASGDCTVAGSTVHILGAGACTITASQDGNANYNPAPDVSRSFEINRAAQTITFAPLANKTLGASPFSVTASSSSGLAVSFSATGSCTVAGGVVTITGVAACTITASQGGNSNYEPAPDVSRTFFVFWPFDGFFPPIQNGELNVANAGSAIPVKFSLGGDRSLAIFTTGAPQVTQISCATGAPESVVGDATSAGSSSLSYGNKQYVFVWKTDKAWAGTCKQLNLNLADGSDRTASFRFK